jgi:predicted AlkP superfamily pyrophosphatase or phosphodiesterase
MLKNHNVRCRYEAIATLFVVATLLTGCFGGRYVRTYDRPHSIDKNLSSRPGHVVLISIDGLRPDAITTNNAPTLHCIAMEGSYTMLATTVLPSKTLPSHASMLTGQPPEVHGIFWDTNVGLRGYKLETPTVFSILRPKGYTTAAFFSKAKFSGFQLPGTLDYSEAPGGWFGRWSADRVVGDVERYLSSEQPNLVFIHVSEPDTAGHESGFMSDKYIAAVKRADTSVQRILTIAERDFGKGNFTMIVTADHGGHDHDHGSDDERDVRIPWVAWGRGVKPGQLTQDVTTMDTAATILFLFGITTPADWVGRPVVGAFQQETLQ